MHARVSLAAGLAVTFLGSQAFAQEFGAAGDFAISVERIFAVHGSKVHEENWVDGEPDYEELVAAGGTLVLFMGLGRLSALADGLVAAGMAPDTPSAVVSRGTLPDQRTVAAPLAALASAAEGLPGPALVVVGDVVSLRARIASSSAAATPARARA